MSEKTKIKICFFGDTAAYHLWRWAKYFSHKGHDVSVITLNPQIIDDFGKVKVYFLEKLIPGANLISRTLNLVPTLLRLKKLIKKIKPNVIHSHSAGGYAWLPMFLELHPFVITPWGSDILIPGYQSSIERFFTKLAFKKADLITCDGENTRQTVISLGVPGKKIRFITFGVDIKKFKQNPKDKKLKNALRATNSKIVINTRFLTEIHDVKTFIIAIPLVLKEFTNVKFVIVGDGPQKESLMNLAKNLGVSNVTKFVGQVSEEKMVLYLNVADIYVSCSLSESGLAASTAEAMACELPIINTDTGDIKLWIKDGKGGFVVPTKAPEILAKKIIYLLKNDRANIEFGKINRKIIEHRNNYYKEMEKMEKIYQELAGNEYEN